MSLKQKKNKHLKTKSNKATGRKGSVRGKRDLKHGKGKGMISILDKASKRLGK